MAVSNLLQKNNWDFHFLGRLRHVSSGMYHDSWISELSTSVCSGQSFAPRHTYRFSFNCQPEPALWNCLFYFLDSIGTKAANIPESVPKPIWVTRGWFQWSLSACFKKIMVVCYSNNNPHWGFQIRHIFFRLATIYRLSLRGICLTSADPEKPEITGTSSFRAATIQFFTNSLLRFPLGRILDQ